MLLVGSQALKHHFPEESRTPNNCNVWLTIGEANDLSSSGVISDDINLIRSRIISLKLSGECLKLELHEERTSDDLFEEINSNEERTQIDGLGEVIIAKPSSQLMIKRSELYYPTNDWEKHMYDYHFLKNRVSEEDISDDEKLASKQRTDELKERFRANINSSTKSLMMKNEDFFGGFNRSFIRIYEHDDLHTATKYYEDPLYYQLKDDKSLAYVPRKNFESLSCKDKIRLVQEETYAIALERVIIPSIEFGVEFSENSAYRFALRRICTNLTRGWFRDFAIENYPDIVNYDTPFVDRYRTAVELGLIKRKHTVPWTTEDLEQVDIYFATYKDEWIYV